MPLPSPPISHFPPHISLPFLLLLFLQNAIFRDPLKTKGWGAHDKGKRHLSFPLNRKARTAFTFLQSEGGPSLSLERKWLAALSILCQRTRPRPFPYPLPRLSKKGVRPAPFPFKGKGGALSQGRCKGHLCKPPRAEFVGLDLQIVQVHDDKSISASRCNRRWAASVIGVYLNRVFPWLLCRIHWAVRGLHTISDCA